MERENSCPSPLLRSYIMDSITQYWRTEQFCDVVIFCNGQQLLGHKLILAACSAVLKDMIINSSEEICHHSRQMLKIEIDYITFPVLHNILNFLYTQHLPSGMENLGEIIKAGEILGLKDYMQINQTHCQNETVPTPGPTQTKTFIPDQITGSVMEHNHEILTTDLANVTVSLQDIKYEMKELQQSHMENTFDTHSTGETSEHNQMDICDVVVKLEQPEYEGFMPDFKPVISTDLSTLNCSEGKKCKKKYAGRKKNQSGEVVNESHAEYMNLAVECSEEYRFTKSRIIHQPDRFEPIFISKQCSKSSYRKVKTKNTKSACKNRIKTNASNNSTLSEDLTQSTANAKSKIYRRCNKCHKYFTSPKWLIRHRKICKASLGPYNVTMCRVCNKRFESNEELVRHRKEEHGKSKTATPQYKFSCHLCEKKYNEKYQFLRHQFCKHQIPYPDNCVIRCPEIDCWYQTSNKGTMERHKKTHEAKPPRGQGPKPFQCDICGQHFRRVQGLKAHMDIHTKSKDVKCNICGSLFLNTTRRNSHIKRAHQREKLLCDLCPYRVKSELSLSFHKLKVHGVESKIPSYKCEQCPLIFPLKHQLSKHMQRHSGIFSFSCEQPGCDKKFVTLNELNHHKKVHLDKKDYVCTHEGCGKAFRTSQNLKSHIAVIHTGGKPWGCHICSYRASTKGNLTKHFRCVHKLEVITNQLFVNPKQEGFVKNKQQRDKLIKMGALVQNEFGRYDLNPEVAKQNKGLQHIVVCTDNTAITSTVTGVKKESSGNGLTFQTTTTSDTSQIPDSAYSIVSEDNEAIHGSLENC